MVCFGVNHGAVARRLGSSAGAFLAIAMAALALPSPASAVADSVTVTFTGTLGGKSIEEIDENRLLDLRPDQELPVMVRVTNTTDEPVHVSKVRFDGKVLGVTFFDYAARVDLDLAPHSTDERQFALDVSDLGTQAIGRLPARLALVAEDRRVLAEEEVPVKVEGSLRSVYGTFSLLVALVTLMLLAAALARLALGLLPVNRWFRATRFGILGIGLGLTFTFGLSAFGLVLPNSGTWLRMVIGGGLVGLIAGFLTPAPDDETERPRVVDNFDIEPQVPAGSRSPRDVAHVQVPMSEPVRPAAGLARTAAPRDRAGAAKPSGRHARHSSDVPR